MDVFTKYEQEIKKLRDELGRKVVEQRKAEVRTIQELQEQNKVLQERVTKLESSE